MNDRSHNSTVPLAALKSYGRMHADRPPYHALLAAYRRQQRGIAHHWGLVYAHTPARAEPTTAYAFYLSRAARRRAGLPV